VQHVHAIPIPSIPLSSDSKLWFCAGAAIFFVCAGCAVVGIQKDESGETRVARMSRRMSTTGRSSTAETPGAGNDTKLFNGKDATEMAC
jgi:hypothetical protein